MRGIDGRSRSERTGGFAVEVAVVMPLLLSLLVGLWEYGRLIQIHQIVNNAAREGGRQASTAQKSDSDIQSFTINYLKRALNTGTVDRTVGASVQITNLTRGGSNPQDSLKLDTLEVIVRLPYDNVRLLFLNTMIPEGSEVVATSVWNSAKDDPVIVETNPPIE